ncbi:MAG: GDSL-type esterase/lipase family protein [Prevotella sp.]|nr:GDSL-type esterase/lipase family protein [Prevotella sp.]
MKKITVMILAIILPILAIAGEPVKKVLFIGDSMTGWMAERLNAYGAKNGFEVATYTWDGSTIKKWANSPRFKQIVEQQNPDAVFVCLGMNDMFQTNPQAAFGASVQKIKQTVGNADLLWIGPPSWPGKNLGEPFNKWMSQTLGDEFYRSFDLTLPRQSKSNPHPTKDGIIKWMDEIVEWIPTHTNIKFPGLIKPTSTDKQMLRGKIFVYKRMKETL